MMTLKTILCCPGRALRHRGIAAVMLGARTHIVRCGNAAAAKADCREIRAAIAGHRSKLMAVKAKAG
jgi:hypothetical protein